MARPNNYNKKVKPYLDDIAEMTCSMTDEDIAKELGIGYSTWCRYKKDYEELREVLKGGRRKLVKNAKSWLIKKAEGFDYTETKEIYELNIETGELEVTKVEKNTKRALPDVAAINLLLKNYDKDNWSNDPQMMEIRRKELELREKQAEEGGWS